MLVNGIQDQSYGKYIPPANSTKHIKSQIDTNNQSMNLEQDKAVEVNQSLDQAMLNNSHESSWNYTHMEIINLYNTLDSNSYAKIDSLAQKYAQLLIEDTQDINHQAKKDVANFVINSHTNNNHENMLFLKSLIESHYPTSMSHSTVTDHQLGYCDPNDYTIIYAVLSGIRRKNL